MSGLKPRVIAVASGKGGTGKTTMAAHLALAATRAWKTLLVDLDVEAPDALGYFPDAVDSGGYRPALVRLPRLIPERCTGCGLCAKACRFGAILAIGGVVTIDGRVCKGCGRCVAACPAGALAEADLEVGGSSQFEAGRLGIIEGRMSVGDIRSTAVIEATKRRAAEANVDVQIRDCPPGVTCPTVHAIAGADYLVLVAEPTEFSLHDLGAAIAFAQGCGMPLGVVVNKDGFGKADVTGFCEARGAPVVGRIAFRRERAEAGAAAMLWVGDESIMWEMGFILARAFAPARGREAVC